MDYNKYLKGKNEYLHLMEMENSDNRLILQSYNEFLNENDLDEFLLDCVYEKIADEIMEAGVVEASKDAGKAIGTAVKKFIGKKKLQNNVKKYYQAYLSWQMQDIHLLKMKADPKWGEKSPEQKKQAELAIKKEKEQMKEHLSAIQDRMDAVGDRFGIRNLVSAYKAIAKVKATKKVIILAKKLYSDGEYKKLQTKYEDLVIKAKDAKKAVEDSDKEDKDIDQVKVLTDRGYTKIKSEDKDKHDANKITTAKDKEGNEVLLLAPDDKGDKKSDDKTGDKKSDEPDKKKSKEEVEIEKIDKKLDNEQALKKDHIQGKKDTQAIKAEKFKEKEKLKAEMDKEKDEDKKKQISAKVTKLAGEFRSLSTDIVNTESKIKASEKKIAELIKQKNVLLKKIKDK